LKASEKKRVYITREISGAAERVLSAAGCVVEISRHRDRPLTVEELHAAAAGADGVLCLLNDKINEALFRAAPRCKVYANFAVGFDNMDVAAARRVGEGERMVRAGEFHGWAPQMLLGYEVTGKTLGIVGAGRIGTAMARMARGFDMKLLYTKRSGESAEMQALGGRCVQLEELLKKSDFVSVHAPLTSDTRHMISGPQFALMKPTAILVNTGRGPIVDEAALAGALQQKQIAAAGLDVYEREPQVEARLLGLGNVVLAPHLGSATHEARDAMAELAANSILDCFAGRVPRTCLNPEVI
jgi:glyoxylate reductase